MAALKFHIVKKIHHRPKSEGKVLCLQGLHTWPYSKNDRSITMRTREL